MYYKEEHLLSIYYLLEVEAIIGGKNGSCGDLVLMCHKAGCGPPPRAKKSPLSDAAPSQLPSFGLLRLGFCPGFKVATCPDFVRTSQIRAVPSSEAEANWPVTLHWLTE